MKLTSTLYNILKSSIEDVAKESVKFTTDMFELQETVSDLHQMETLDCYNEFYEPLHRSLEGLWKWAQATARTCGPEVKSKVCNGREIHSILRFQCGISSDSIQKLIALSQKISDPSWEVAKISAKVLSLSLVTYYLVYQVCRRVLYDDGVFLFRRRIVR